MYDATRSHIAHHHQCVQCNAHHRIASHRMSSHNNRMSSHNNDKISYHAISCDASDERRATHRMHCMMYVRCYAIAHRTSSSVRAVQCTLSHRITSITSHHSLEDEPEGGPWRPRASTISIVDHSINVGSRSFRSDLALDQSNSINPVGGIARSALSKCVGENPNGIPF